MQCVSFSDDPTGDRQADDASKNLIAFKLDRLATLFAERCLRDLNWADGSFFPVGFCLRFQVCFSEEGMTARRRTITNRRAQAGSNATLRAQAGTKASLDAFANRLGQTKALRHGAIVLRMTGPGGGEFRLDCTSEGARLFKGFTKPETALIEVTGDAQSLRAIFEGKKNARAEFHKGGIRVRGDLRYLSDLALELGIIRRPL